MHNGIYSLLGIDPVRLRAVPVFPLRRYAERLHAGLAWVSRRTPCREEGVGFIH